MPADPPGDGSQMFGLLLCVSHISPWPTFAGGSYRLHRLLSWCEAQNWQVVLVHLPDSAPGGDGGRSPTERYRDVITIDSDGSIRSVTDTPRVRSAMAELATAPVPVDALMQRLRPGAVIATQPGLARGISGSGATGRRFLVDLEGNPARHAAAGAGEIAELVARGWTVASTDPAVMREVAPGSGLRDSRVTIGTSFDVAPLGESAAGSTMLLVGSDTPENRAGLREFLEFAWPLVRRQVADAELVIAGMLGAGETPTGPGVRRLGTVEDVGSLYRACVVAIDPAVDGASPHVKTAEALAHLRPIVTWPAGVIGLPAALRDLTLVATDWFAFARNVTLAMRSSFASAQLGRRRAEVDRLLSPDSAYAALAAALATGSSTRA